MAKKGEIQKVSKNEVFKKKRAGIHSKKKTSKLKSSKNYKKTYRSQGR